MAILAQSILSDYVKSFSGLKKSCWQGIILNFIVAILSGIYYFLSLYLVNVLHFNISDAGIIISSYGLGTIFGGLIGGRLSDKISAKSVSVVSLLIQALGFLILVKLRNPFLIAMDLLIIGLATYSFTTSNYLGVLEQCDNEEKARLKALSMLSVASNLGFGVSALIISEFAYTSFSDIFQSIAGILLILALFLFFQKTNKKKSITKLSRNIEENGTQNKNLALVILCLFFTGMIVSQLGTTYPIYLENRFPELGAHAFSVLFSVNVVLVICFQNYLVNQCSQFNKLVMIGTGSFLIGLGMLTLNFSFVFSVALISCLIYSCGEMIFFSMTQLFFYEHSPQNKKGSGLGNYRMVYALSRLVGPAAGGIVYHHFNGNVVWYLSGLIGVFFLFGCIYFDDGDNRILK